MDYFDTAVKKTMEFLAVDSVQKEPCAQSPFGIGVAKCLSMAEDIAKENLFRTFNNGYYVWAEKGEGELFGILGHLDTVPFEGNWTANPLGEIKGDYIYGRGVLDDKGPMIASFYAFCELLSQGLVPKKRVRFIFGGNEESGWKCMEKYCECDEVPIKGISPDGDFPVINCEKGVAHLKAEIKKPATLISIKGGVRVNIVMDECHAKVKARLKERDLEDFKVKYEDGYSVITAKGKPAHGSTPDIGDNACHKILKFLAKELKGEYKTLEQLLCHTDGKSLGIAFKDGSGTLTFNLGTIESNDKSIIAGIDIRHPISIERKVIEEILKSSPYIDSIETLNFHDPHFVSPQSELVTELLKAYNDVCLEKAKPISIGGATYARVMKEGVAFGPIFPGEESTIHQKDERVSLTLFRKMYDIYKQAFKNLLF